MDQSLFRRLLRLSSRTRDKIVFVDPETGRASVLMSLGAYEDLLDGPGFDAEEEEEFDIPDFAHDHDEDIWNPESLPETPVSAAQSALEDEEKFYLEPLE